MIRSILALSLLLPLLAAQETRPPHTVRIGTWNLENLGFRKVPARPEDAYQRIGALIRELGVDLLAVQEIGGEGPLGEVAAAVGPEWRYVLGTTGDFSDSDDAIRVGFLWNDARLELLHAGELLQFPRRVGEVPIFHRIPVVASFRSRDGGIDFRAVTVHLKASRGELNEQKRTLEVRQLRDWLTELTANPKEDRDVVVLGDFNHTYGAPAYEEFVQGGAVRYLRPAQPGFTIVHFDDPIDMIAVGPGLDEAREGSLTVHNRRAAEDKEAWRLVYSDHVPVTVDLDASADRDPDATLTPPEHVLSPSSGRAGLPRAGGAGIAPGDAVHVVLVHGGYLRGTLLQPLGEWVQLRTEDGEVVAVPRENVARVSRR